MRASAALARACVVLLHEFGASRIGDLLLKFRDYAYCCGVQINCILWHREAQGVSKMETLKTKDVCGGRRLEREAIGGARLEELAVFEKFEGDTGGAETGIEQ